MEISDAIKKAIEGGYKPKEYFERNYFIVKKDAHTKSIGANMTESEILLDPQFWICLSKAMGWKGEPISDCKCIPGCKNDWQYQWHRFIDFLAEEKTAEDYFRELNL